ncbi:MAG: EAL domain-containing protein [Actinomycetota bacterium]
MTVLPALTEPRVSGSRRSAGSAWVVLSLSVVALIGYAFAVPDTQSILFAVVAVACVASLMMAPRFNRPNTRLPWRLLAVTAVLFLVGAVLRASLADAAGHLTSLWPDAFTLGGYACIGSALVMFLRHRRGHGDAGSRSDAVVVGVGAILLAWSFLVVPTLGADGAGTALRVVSSLYPPIDALLLFVVAQIAFTDVSRAPAFWLLLLCMVAIFTGDIAYAVDIARIAHPPIMLRDGPFLIAYGAMAATALHPSMVVLTVPQPARVRALVRGRLVTVAAAVVAPVLVILVNPPGAGLRDRVVLAVGISLLFGAVLQRSVRAVNQHAKSEAFLAVQATHDALTGLPNRTKLSERTAADLHDARGSGHAVGVFFIDIDRFKVLNDTWGHGAGDELLVAVGTRLRAVVRDDDCVARAGGDEFAIVCRIQQATEEPTAIADRLFSAFADPFRLSVGDMVLTPSIGIAVAEGDAGYTAERLIRDADIAMYRAKDAGRNRWSLFTTAMHDAVAERLSIEQDLRRAMEAGTISLHYQPIVELAHENLGGFEALARMEIDGRRVPPDVFIPVAEETGLILPLGRWVLREAVRQLGLWRNQYSDLHPDLYMSVNVSARQLRDPELIPMVRAEIAKHGVPPHALRLEITESVLMDDAEAAMLVLQQLRDIGVHLYVDDFGTGYSSLGYLKRFPVSTVKIDRSFVSGLGADTDDQEIVRAVVAMAQALSLTVVAEGVETLVQRDCLRAMGCTSAQGWHYGKPLPAAEAVAAFIAPTPEERAKSPILARQLAGGKRTA